MKRVLVLLFFVVFSATGYAAFERLPAGARSSALGGAAGALSGNPWAASSNPAMLFALEQREISIEITPSPFGLPELTGMSACYSEPTSIGTIALHLSRFGFDLYREVISGVSIAHSFGGHLSLGVTLRAYSLTIAKYGADWTLGIDAGGAIEFSERVRFGFAVQNISASTIGSSRESLPQSVLVGVEFRPFQGFTVAADLAKDIRYPPEVRVGTEYAILQIIFIRAGIVPEPAFLTVGMGVRHESVEFDYSLSHHPVLGSTHALSLSITAPGF